MSPIRLIFRLIGIHDDAILYFFLSFFSSLPLSLRRLVDLLLLRWWRLLRRRPRGSRCRPRGLLLLLLGDHEHGVMGRWAGGRWALLRRLSLMRRTWRHCSLRHEMLVHVVPGGGDVVRGRGLHRNRGARHVLRRRSRVRDHDTAGLSPACRHHRGQVRVGRGVSGCVRDDERVALRGQRGQRLGLLLSRGGRGGQLRCVALRHSRLLHV